MIIKLNDRVNVIRPEAKAVFPYSNSLYIEDEITVVIDSGSGGRAYKEIPVNNIDILLISHYHFDHVNGISFFKNAQVMAGEEEAQAYNDPDIYSEFAGYKRWQELMGETNTGSFASKATMPDDVPSKPGYQKINLDKVFVDGDVFDLGKTKLTAIHTPGHSHGHYAFYLENDGILFSADLDISPWGPWYGGGYSDFDDLVKSVEKLIEIKPKILATSHRKVFYNDIEKHFKNYIDIALKKEENIYKYVAIPRNFEEIASQDFAYSLNERTPHIIFWTKMMVLRHLERMQKLGQIIKNEENEYVRI